MDHRLGQIHLIAWQTRKTRRLKPGASGWTLLALTCACLGLVGAVAEAVGWVHLPGLAASVPAALVLLAFTLQLGAMLRGVLAWIAG
jgi:hypothetical protein